MNIWYSSFITNGIIVVSGLISGVLTARLLGVEDRGSLAAVIYWPHFIAGIAALGINESIVIYTSKNGASNTLKTTVIAVSMGLSVLVGMVGSLLMPYLINESRLDYLIFIQIYFVVFIPLTYLSQNLLAVDQGEFKFHRFNAQRIIQAISYPILLLVLWKLELLTVESASISVLMGTAIVAFLRIWDTKSDILTIPSYKEAKELLSVGIRLHTVNMAMFLAMQVDKMTLVLLATDVDLGIYSVAFTAAGAFTSLLVQTYINIMLPKASLLGAQQLDISIVISLRRLIYLIAIFTFLSIPIMPYLISLVFGVAYDPASRYAQVLLLAFAFIGIKKAFLYILRSWHDNRSGIYGEGITAIVLLFGAYVSMRVWGIMGISILVAVANFLGMFLIVYFFLKKTNVSLKQFFSASQLIR